MTSGHIAPGRRQPHPDLVLLVGGEVPDAQQHVDVVAQPPLGRQAAPRGVRVPEQADLFQIPHDRSNGRGRHVQPITAGDRM